MAPISMVATFPAIDAAALPAFEAEAAGATAAVKNETGNRRYDWFFTADRTACSVHEEYTDSAAVLAHLGNVGPIVGRLAELGGGLVVDVYGDLSPDLAAALSGRVRTVYTPYVPAG